MVCFGGRRPDESNARAAREEGCHEKRGQEPHDCSGGGSLCVRADGARPWRVGRSSAASRPGDRAKLVGTYEMVTTEVKDPATGRWSPTPNFNSNGYIIYADTGHMGVHIMPKVRARFTSQSPDRRRSAGRAPRLHGVLRLLRGQRQRAGEVRRPPSLRPDQPGRRGRREALLRLRDHAERQPAPHSHAGAGRRRRQGQGDAPARLAADARCAALSRTEEVRRVLAAPLHGQLPDQGRERGLPRQQGRDAHRHVLHHLHVVGPHDGAPHEQGGARRSTRARSRPPTRRSRPTGATTATSDGS